MGGDVAAQMIAATYAQLSLDLQRAREDLRKQGDELRAVNEQLTQCKTENATLKERVESGRRHRHVRDFGIALGSILLAIGIPLVPTSTGTLRWLGVSLSTLGTLALLVAWFSGDRRAAP